MEEEGCIFCAIVLKLYKMVVTARRSSKGRERKLNRRLTRKDIRSGTRGRNLRGTCTGVV